MQWYVRTECGDVRGPMDKEDAEQERDRLDGAVMYNERIFEPEFVVSSEVETLVKDLGCLVKRFRLCRDCGGFDSEDRELCQRAIDTITLLCKVPELPVVTSEEITRIIADLDEMKDYEPSEEFAELCQRAIDALVHLSATTQPSPSSKVTTWAQLQSNQDVSAPQPVIVMLPNGARHYVSRVVSGLIQVGDPI